MILVILFIIAIILGLILAFVFNKKCWDFTIPVSLTSIGIFGCILCGGLILCARTSKAYYVYYTEWNRKHSGLEARIEAWNKGGEDPYLWDDVKEFNVDLEQAQRWANSYWTNWMNEQACNEFGTFDMPDYRRSNE